MKQRKSHPDDETCLMFRVKCGDYQAFDELHQKYKPIAQAFFASCGCPGKSLDDLTQEVFVRVWEHRGRFRGDSSVQTYLFGIAKHVLHEELRRRGKSPNTYFDNLSCLGEPFKQEPSIEQRQPDREELSEAIKQAKAKLPPAQREAFELDQIYDLPRTEIAKLANCTPSQFTDRLYRAKQRLRHFLKDIRR